MRQCSAFHWTNSSGWGFCPHIFVERICPRRMPIFGLAKLAIQRGMACCLRLKSPFQPICPRGTALTGFWHANKLRCSGNLRRHFRKRKAVLANKHAVWHRPQTAGHCQGGRKTLESMAWKSAVCSQASMDCGRWRAINTADCEHCRDARLVKLTDESWKSWIKSAMHST